MWDAGAKEYESRKAVESRELEISDTKPTGSSFFDVVLVVNKSKGLIRNVRECLDTYST